MAYTPLQTAFIHEADEKISDNPLTRLTPVTQAVMLRNNYVFDAHCHIFDSHCIDAKYLALRMLAGVPEMLKPTLWKAVTGKAMTHEMKLIAKEELVEEVYQQPDILLESNDANELISTMETNLAILEQESLAVDYNKATKFGLGEWLKRYRQILSLLKTNKMESVFKRFHDDYGIHKIAGELDGTNYELLTVVLGMDLNQGWTNSNIKKTQAQQNAELASLAKTHPILPFLPVDPRRADINDLQNENSLYRIFINAFKAENPGFFGVKVYPALGYAPADPRLKPIFEICAKKRIPVMTHCGGGSVSTFDFPIHVNRNGITESISVKPRAARARILNEPGEWTPVLESHPKLKMCFAHFGSGKAWSEPAGVHAKRIPVILDFMKKYEVYADFSYNIESPNATDKFLEKMRQTNEEGDLMRKRVLYGTDFWVILPTSNLNLDQRNYLNKLDQLRKNLLRDNVLRFLGLMQ